MTSSVKVVGRFLILVAFCAAVYLVFADGISYWTGWGSSRIENLSANNMTFVRDDRIRFGGPGVHFKNVKYYKTQEGEGIAVFQPAGGEQQRLFIRGSHRIYNNVGFDEITTYEPFALWTYLSQRIAVLFVLSLMMLVLAGLALKLVGKGHNG